MTRMRMEDSRNSVETEWETGERDRAPGTVRKEQRRAYFSGASPARSSQCLA